MTEKKTIKKPTTEKTVISNTTRKKSSKAASKEQPAHILLRLKSESGKTINAHQNIIDRKGTVLLGKMGRAGVGTKFIDDLNQQIERGIKTFLFLATRSGWNTPYIMYACQLRQVHNTLDDTKRNLVPGYYIDESHNIKTWFEISNIDRLPQEYAERIFVLSSERSITSALNSLTSVFRVGVQEKKK